MLTWLLNLPCTKLTFSKDSWFSQVFEQRFARSGFEYALVQAPSDLGLYTVFALMIDKGRNVVSTGSSTKPIFSRPHSRPSWKRYRCANCSNPFPKTENRRSFIWRNIRLFP